MAKKKKMDEGEQGAPMWVVTYGDMMSLLLTFFILLLSFSTLEEKKVREAISSLKGALGVLPRSPAPVQRPEPRPMDITKPTRTEQTESKIRKLREQLRSQGLDRQIQVGQSHKGLLNIRIPDSVLFRSGSAELLESAFPVLEDVADLLRDHLEMYDSDMRVEGHTDDVPISPALSATFPTNWELSTARALSVMRFFTTRTGLPENHFGVAGYGPHKPLFLPENVEENRRRNRRVEIIAIPMRDEDLEPDDPFGGPTGVQRQPIPRDDLPEPL